MMLWIAVHFAALAVGAWLVLSPGAALLLASPALLLAVIAIPLDVQAIMRAMFALVYRRWLWDHWDKGYCRVVRVTGWRSALVETQGGKRRHMTACFWGLE
jgi:hypothetical protein